MADIETINNKYTTPLIYKEGKTFEELDQKYQKAMNMYRDLEHNTYWDD